MKDLVKNIRELFAETYRQAALQEADMVALAAHLERIRGQWTEPGNTLAARAAIETAIGASYGQPIEQYLHHLRDAFFILQKEIWAEELLALRPVEERWTYFLTRYAECITRWRTRLLLWWTRSAIDGKWFPVEKKAALERLDVMAQLMEYGRWAEVYHFLRELAQHTALNDKLRAHLWAICASIQTYHVYNPEAKADLDAAQKLYAELPFLALCRADYERTERRYDQSREILDVCRNTHPEDPDVWISIGKLHQEQGQTQEVAAAYQKAVEVDPGNLAGYRQLIGYWGSDKTLYEQHRADIPALVEKGARIDPEDVISLYIEAGYACLNAEDMPAAEQWLRKALAEDPQRISNLIAMGYFYQKNQNYAEAARYYQQAVAIAPAAIDGYWNMGEMLAIEGKHAEAAKWLEQALPHCPLYGRHLNSRLCEHLTNEGAWEKALEAGLEALRIDPQYSWALDALHTLSDKLRDAGYQEKTGPEKAIGILDAIKELRGHAYEANYHNRCGNIYYYFSQYVDAIEQYKKAVAADAAMAVYYDNLAGALEKQAGASYSADLYEAAYKAAASAHDVDPGNTAYQQNKNRLETEFRRARHFGIPAAGYSANTAPITLRYKYELKILFENNGYIVDPLYKKVNQLINRVREQYGITIPPVAYQSDWNIVADANFVIDFDGIPIVQMMLNHDEAAFDDIVRQLETELMQRLADFVHFDTADVSEKFIGKPLAFTSGLLQLSRVLLKQKIPVKAFSAMHDLYEKLLAEGKNLQQIAEEIRRAPEIRPFLPLNTAPNRALTTISPELETEILGAARKTRMGARILVTDYTLLNRINEEIGHLLGAQADVAHFILTKDPQAASLLASIIPGFVFSEAELLEPMPASS